MVLKWLCLIVIILLYISPLHAKEKYADPDSHPVEEAARKALPSAEIRTIIGISRSIEGILEELGATVTEHEIRIELSADVLFDFDKYDIRTDAVDTLKKVAEVVKEYSQAKLNIEGHTDSVGSDQYNQKLSEKRADSVKKWFVTHAAVQAFRITTKGWGETKPIVPNKKPDGSDNSEGRKKNRRVEVIIKK
jgi:outer membrane protein OmpA-like peptidoglycan-associated protein